MKTDTPSAVGTHVFYATLSAKIDCPNNAWTSPSNLDLKTAAIRKLLCYDLVKFGYLNNKYFLTPSYDPT